ncbi:CWF19-like protein 2 isoform X2 [Ptychodera flava]|uniref:CWF19-like protein 2 isoform X2 n=1 Tax=Ptychodera flava TaxID=63121 RepID=UPI003969CDC4
MCRPTQAWPYIELTEHLLFKSADVVTAKAKYEERERKKEEASQRGDDVWMLPSVNKRIDAEKERVKAKKHKKEKKHKKHKKHKKQKSRHSDTGENSSSDSEVEDQWVEKVAAGETEEDSVTASPAGPPIKGPSLPPPESQEQKRADWMEKDPFSFATYTRDDLRKHKREDKEKQDKWKEVLEKPGMSTRELNPFWKDGGMGLPSEKPGTTKKSISVPGIGDGGLSWLKKAYERACEEAEEKGLSLEEVMAYRYGSLEKFQAMMKAAKESASKCKEKEGERSHDRYGDRGDRYRGTDRGTDRERERGSNRDPERYRHRDRDMDGTTERSSRDSDRYRERDSDRYRNNDRGNDRYKSRESDEYKDRGDQRYTSSHRSGRTDDEDRSPRREKESSGERSKDSRRYSKDSSKSQSSSSSGGLLSSFGKKFMRPSDSIEETERVRPSSSRGSFARDSDVPRWKNKAFIKPSEDGESTHRSSSGSGRNSNDVPAWKKTSKVSPSRQEHGNRSESDKSDSASESSASSSESEEERAPSPIKVLTEKEMNELGAKLVRAELMGDEETVSKIKSQMDSSRKAKETHEREMAVLKSLKRKTENSDEEEEESELVLSRMDKSGQSWPVEQTVERETGKKRRRKKVATHDAGGQRERYFADDDRYDLKKMVQRERMSTAEDQNSMFSRLAGRATEKLDGDNYTLDDMFVSKASKQMSEAEMQERDRAKAIAQQKRQNEQIDKCLYCFGNKAMPKHLIIAIGLKVYLCLPSKQSLTEGHCFIIPMQHSTSATLIDEDVWSEVKIFRKGLTKMFEEQEQDTVFLETFMNPRSHRHMVIECIPVPKEEGDMAPIYFKKAIMESESEWAQNKKLVDTRQKDIRRSIPKGLPYFSVEFGLGGGFAHVIEDNQTFPHYFGKEVIGGMLDLEPRRWRNPPKQSFEDHRQKVLKFAEWWKPYDWTQKIDRD